MYRVLRVVSGPLEGEEFLLEERLEIGRSGELRVQLIGASVSRRHAEVRLEPSGRAVVTDLGSRNGTFVNGERIEHKVLALGDTLEIGKSTFQLEERPGEAPPELERPALSLLSGPALDVTATIQRPQPGLLSGTDLRPTTAPSARVECADPLHELARQKRWRFCPVCGESPSGSPTGEHEIPSRNDDG